MVYPPYEEVAPAEIAAAAGDVPAGDSLRMRISGMDAVGDVREWVVLLPLPEGATGEERLEAAGLTLVDRDGKMIIDDVAYDSPAQKVGLDWDQEIIRVLKPASPPTKYLMYIPAILLLALVIWAQRRRVENSPGRPREATA